MSNQRLLRRIYFGAVLSLSLLIHLSVCSAQDAERALSHEAQRTAKRKSLSTRTLLAAERVAVLADNKNPIVVFPGGRGFKSFQAAIDYACSQGKSLTRGDLTGSSTIFLQPGTYVTGNFVINLTLDLYIVGIGGAGAVTIEGVLGVNQATLGVSKVGSSYHEMELTGVSLYNAVAPALQFTGNQASVDLDIGQCYLETGFTGSAPAIRMTGGGASDDNRMGLHIHDSTVEADSNGDTGSVIDGDVTAFADINFFNCETLESKGVYVQVVAQVPGTVNLAVVGSRMEGDDGTALHGIVANNVNNLRLLRSTIDSDQDAVLVTDTGNAEIQYCNLLAKQGYGVKVLTGSTGSNAYVAFTGFLSPQTIFTANGSTTTACLNHWNFTAF